MKNEDEVRGSWLMLQQTARVRQALEKQLDASLVELLGRCRKSADPSVREAVAVYDERLALARELGSKR